MYPDHLWQRLKVDPGTKDLGNWIEKAVEPLKDLPRYLVPCYFDLFVTGLYLAVLEKCFKLMTRYAYMLASHFHLGYIFVF